MGNLTMTNFAGRCADKHETMLFSDPDEWAAHHKGAHRNTGSQFRPDPGPRMVPTISAREKEWLGRWVTFGGKLGQVFSLAPGPERVWVSFGGSDIALHGTFELTGAAMPEHTLSLPDAPAAAPVAAAPTMVALEVTPEPTRAPVATRTPRRPRTPRPATHRAKRQTTAAHNGREVETYWQSIAANYFAAIS